MNYVRILLFLGLVGIALPSNAQWYKYYQFVGEDAEQLAPIWGWNIAIAFPMPLGEGLGKKMEKDKWSFAMQGTPIVNWENIYMFDQLTIGKADGVTSYYMDTISGRVYESRPLSYQSKHRFIKTGAQFFFLLNRNEFLVSLELQPNFLIGGDVKQRYTQDGDRTQSRIRYKDDADFYNFRRFNLLTDLRIQYGWLVASAGIEALPMFRDGLGPDLRKAFFSIGLTIPPSMQFEPTKALEKLDKLEFDM